MSHRHLHFSFSLRQKKKTKHALKKKEETTRKPFKIQTLKTISQLFRLNSCAKCLNSNLFGKTFSSEKLNFVYNKIESFDSRYLHRSGSFDKHLKNMAPRSRAKKVNETVKLAAVVDDAPAPVKRGGRQKANLKIEDKNVELNAVTVNGDNSPKASEAKKENKRNKKTTVTNGAEATNGNAESIVKEDVPKKKGKRGKVEVAQENEVNDDQVVDTEVADKNKPSASNRTAKENGQNIENGDAEAPKKGRAGKKDNKKAEVNNDAVEEEPIPELAPEPEPEKATKGKRQNDKAADDKKTKPQKPEKASRKKNKEVAPEQEAEPLANIDENQSKPQKSEKASRKRDKEVAPAAVEEEAEPVTNVDDNQSKPQKAEKSSKRKGQPEEPVVVEPEPTAEPAKKRGRKAKAEPIPTATDENAVAEVEPPTIEQPSTSKSKAAKKETKRQDKKNTEKEKPIEIVEENDVEENVTKRKRKAKEPEVAHVEEDEQEEADTFVTKRTKKVAEKRVEMTRTAKTTKRKATTVDYNEVTSDEDGEKVVVKGKKKVLEKTKVEKVKMNATETDYSKIQFDIEEEHNFKISSWNVAGLRALTLKGGMEYFEYEKPDIICLQVSFKVIGT